MPRSLNNRQNIIKTFQSFSITFGAFTNKAIICAFTNKSFTNKAITWIRSICKRNYVRTVHWMLYYSKLDVIEVLFRFWCIIQFHFHCKKCLVMIWTNYDVRQNKLLVCIVEIDKELVIFPVKFIFKSLNKFLFILFIA